MNSLEGKFALVTGGSRGIGRAIVEAFIAEGAHVAFTYLGSAEPAENLVQTLGGRAHGFRVDAADEGQILALFQTLDGMAPLDILVNNAGVLQEKPLLETTAADFDWLMGVNLRGQFLTGREGLRRMARRGGRVINMSSDLSFSGRELYSPYCASKAAVNGLTKSWAREFGPHVLVNAIAPGPIETDMLAPEQMSPEWRKKEEELTVLKRIGQPEDVAALAVFLAGPGGNYLTGQIIGPNGGSVMP